MGFKFNGVDFLDPTNHAWVPRNMLGISGAGHPMYSGVREYEMKWQLTSIGDYYQLLSSFNGLSGSSYIVADLPMYNSTGVYTFASYSGCVLREPEFSGWFNGYFQDVSLLITNIR
jgi:hypothetical protein